MDWESSDHDDLSDYEENHNHKTNKAKNKKKKFSSDHFNQDVLSRFEYYEDRKNKRLIQYKQERYLEENKEQTLAPIQNNTNNNKVDNNHENLVNRLDKIIEKKKNALQYERSKMISDKEKKELEECSFAPKINNTYIL